MENEIMQVIISQGAFAVLFVYMLVYVLKTTKERENVLNTTIAKNQAIIADLAKNNIKIDNIEKDVQEIKATIK